jgi:UDPglucose--hexose-1-phosphate uridylyltransferase
LRSDLRVDPLSDRVVAVAPRRSERPGAPWSTLEPETAEERESCPFCEGNEHRTPPEVFALPAAGREPDSPGWAVRVVPNKFPAFERQEVVVHAPQHVRSLADLGVEQLSLVAEAWHARAKAARADGFPHVFACVNEGRAGGASLPHSHSQLVPFREEPPVQAAEHASASCRVCDYLAWERAEQKRVVAERDGLLLLCPYAGRAPYECLVAPLEHEPDGFESSLLGAGLELAADALRRLREAEGPRAANLWLHNGGHWHLELLPRLTVFASVELGAGYHVNPLPPEQAAEALRGESARS